MINIDVVFYDVFLLKEFSFFFVIIFVFFEVKEILYIILGIDWWVLYLMFYGCRCIMKVCFCIFLSFLIFFFLGFYVNNFNDLLFDCRYLECFFYYLVMFYS